MKSEHAIEPGITITDYPNDRGRMMFNMFLAFVFAGIALGASAAIALRRLDVLPAGIVAGLVVGALALVLLASHDLINVLETATGYDIDQDGDVGLPGRPEERVVLLRARTPQAEQRSDFADFVTGCQIDSSSRKWEGQIGRGKYRQWRDTLISAGWATWVDPQEPKLGWRLTADTDTILAAIDDGQTPDRQARA